MQKAFDLVLKGGLLVDGTGAEPRKGDVGVASGRIAAMGDIQAAPHTEVVDATGLVVAPGFIDIHGHSELLCLAAPGAESKVSAGVTTECSGNCGGSPFPVKGEAGTDLCRIGETLDLDPTWTDAAGFLDELSRTGSAINRIFFVGHGSVRASVLGHEHRKPKRAELEQMKREVAEACEAGCWGLSSGLIYPPGCFAETEELIALAKVAKRYGGIYTSHIRGEGAEVVTAVKEALEIGARSGAGVQINHLKVAGTRNWHLHAQVKELLTGAYRSGADFMADRYPYVASSTWLASVLPEWTYEGGREKLLERIGSQAMRAKISAEVAASVEEDYWGRVRIAWAASKDLKSIEGKSVAEISAERKASPIDAVFEIILADEARTSAIFFSMSEEHLEDVLSWPFVMVASDAGARGLTGPSAEGKPHPRGYGTWTRLLRRYVREKPVLTLAEAVHKLTGMPAKRLGLADRGVMDVGKVADLTVFDPGTVADTATFEEPKRLSTGVAHVLVAGVFVVKDGELTRERPGAVLRRKGT